MKGQVSFEFTKRELGKLEDACEIAIRNVFSGTKKATEAACQEIMQNSAEQVPKETLTLLASAFYEVSRRSDTAATTWAYEAILGYVVMGPIKPELEDLRLLTW